MPLPLKVECKCGSPMKIKDSFFLDKDRKNTVVFVYHCLCCGAQIKLYTPFELDKTIKE